MSDYTPTTEEVRIRYSMDEKYFDEAIEAKWAAEFDRWLAAHDNEIRRTAFVEIVNGINLIDVCEQEAYQRGRADAARDVQALAGYSYIGSAPLVGVDTAIAAARGDDSL